MNVLSILLYIYLVLVFGTDFVLLHFDGAPRSLQLFADAFAGLLLVAAVLTASTKSLIHLPGRYLVLFLLLSLALIAGLIFNEVQSGAVFYGLRKYFRYVPILLLPILVKFPIKERIRHFKFFLFCAFWQLPAVIYQWETQRPTESNTSGDFMVGTLTTSGALTVFLLGTVVAWTAFFAKRRMNGLIYFLILPLLILPTWLNETTSSLILLPLAVGLPFLLLRAPGGNLRKYASVVVLVGLLLPGFVWFYNSNFDRWGGDVTNAMSERGLSYLYRGADERSRADGYREQSEIGRLDSMRMPFLILDDPFNWVVGVGIGNASRVKRDAFAGEYSAYNERYGIELTTYSHLLWEIGLLGLGLCLIFLIVVASDARYLSREPGSEGALGLALYALVPFVLICMLYKSLIFALPVGAGMSLLMGTVIALRAESAHQKVLDRRALYDNPRPVTVA